MFECKICNYQTKIKSDYSKHMITKKHMIRKKESRSQFKCIECDKTFASVKNLDKHNDKYHGLIDNIPVDKLRGQYDNNFVMIDDSLSDLIMTSDEDQDNNFNNVATKLDSIFELPKMAELLKMQNMQNNQNIQPIHEMQYPTYEMQDDDITGIKKQIELLNEHIKDLHEESIGLQTHISNLYKSHIDLLQRVKYLSEQKVPQKNDYIKQNIK